MKTTEIKALEGYFKTENEHWNKHAFEMLCEVLRQGSFENPIIPLQLFDKAIDIFTDQHETPLKAVQEFVDNTVEAKLSLHQKLFVFEWVYEYLRFTVYEGIDLTETKNLIRSHTKRLRIEVRKLSEKTAPLTINIRDSLKAIIQKELEQLTDTIKELEPEQRLNVVLKLIPYVLPKVESVTHNMGEPDSDAPNSTAKW